MTYSVEYHILTKIKKARKGTLFFTEDFLHFGNAKAISKALTRLVEKQKITRVVRGIYSRLVTDPVLGEILPSAESIAKAIAKRDRARIVSSGILALNKLGLSTQVPVNLVYLTDGTSRTINYGKRKIVLKKVSPKNLATKGAISGLVIQALKEIGKNNLDAHEEVIILKYLRKENLSQLEHDIRLAPEWIRVIMRKALAKVKQGA